MILYMSIIHINTNKNNTLFLMPFNVTLTASLFFFCLFAQTLLYAQTEDNHIPFHTCEHSHSVTTSTITIEETPSKKTFNSVDYIRNTLKHEGLDKSPYIFNNRDDAQKELENPKPVPIPTNGDMYIRGKALEKYLSSPGKEYPIFWQATMKYGAFLSRLSQQSGINARTSLSFKGNPIRKSNVQEYNRFAWRLNLPSEITQSDTATLKVSIVNESEQDAYVAFPTTDWEFFYLNSITIIPLNDDRRVTLTSKGARIYYEYGQFKSLKVTPLTRLRPGEAMEISGINFCLTEYYEFSEPGEYELTFVTRRYVDDFGLPSDESAFDFPRKAVVKFKVLTSER